MLVTIASNSDADASQFVNFFPEGLIIPKNAKIGVVNASYVLHEGYIVDFSNNTFNLRLANMNAYAPIVVPNGVYTTAALLAAAIQTALQNWIGTQSAIVQDAFPFAQQTVSANQQGNEITIHLTYASNGSALELLTSTGATPNTFIKDPLKAQGTSGQYVNLTSLPSNNDNYVATGDGGGNHFWLASLSKIGQNFFAIAEYRPQNTDVAQDLFLVHNEGLTKANSPIRIQINGTGKALIFEKINGVTTQINPGTAPDVLPDSTLQIRIPAIDSSSTAPHHAEYYLTSGGQEVEIAVDGTGGRYNVLASDEFLVKYEFEGGSTTGILPSKSDSAALNDAVLANSINAAGGNYKAGDLLIQSASTGAGIGVQVQPTQVGAMGAVLQYVLVSSGEGHAPGDVLDFANGGGGGFKLNVDSVQDNYAVTTVGAGYLPATGIALTGGSGTGATCAITSTDGNGGITGLTITAAGEDFLDGEVLTVTGGNGAARVTIGAIINSLVVIKGLQANLVENPPNQRPLVLYDSISARMSTLSTLINCKDRYDGEGTLDITSENAMITNNRTASNLHIQLDSIGGAIESREFGVNGKTVAIVPLGDNSNAHAGLFNNELFNIIYHNLRNPETLMNNELAVRLTDYKNNVVKSLFHPVTITFDIRPELE